MLREPGAGTPVDGERARPCVGWLSSSCAGRDDADLAPAALGALVGEISVRPEMAACVARLRPGAGGRAWEHLWRDERVDVWLIAWDGGADTGWHDHDTSSGAFLVLEGTVVEERPVGRERTVPRRSRSVQGPPSARTTCTASTPGEAGP